MEITLSGQVPAHKNSKKITCRGGTPRMYTKKKVAEWQRATIKELKLTYRGSADTKVTVDYKFFVKDLRRRDTDNMVAQVNDVLVQAGLLKDDSWKHLRIGSADAELDRDNPRAVITITEDG